MAYPIRRGSFMVPKRRFWKTEQKMKCVFSIDFSMVSSPKNEYSRPWGLENTISSFLTQPFPKSSFGRHTFLAKVVSHININRNTVSNKTFGKHFSPESPPKPRYWKELQKIKYNVGVKSMPFRQNLLDTSNNWDLGVLHCFTNAHHIKLCLMPE